MSVQDFIKKSILQSDNYATQSPFRIVIVLLLALLIGAFIYKVYSISLQALFIHAVLP